MAISIHPPVMTAPEDRRERADDAVLTRFVRLIRTSVEGRSHQSGVMPARRVARGLVLMALVLVCGAMPTRVSAQSSSDADYDDPFAGVEEMIVVGTGGAAALLEGTTSVTAFDADVLTQIGAQDISDISAFTPNLEIVTAGTTSPTLFIRGVGLNDFSPIATGAISVLRDGVPRNAPAILLQRFFDIENVAVLRGPQAVGGYRNASAGAISVETRKPSGDFGAYLNVQYGNYQYVDVEGAVEAPIVPDVLSVRTAFAFMKRDGWMANRCGGLPSYEERVSLGLVRPLSSQTPASGDFSLCGEAVDFQNAPNIPVGLPAGISDVPPGLPRRINARSNFALRTVFKFTPEAPVDIDWIVNLHYYKVNDDSHIGQSIGRQGVQLGVDGERDEIVGSGPRPGAGTLLYADQDELDRLRELRLAFTEQCGGDCFPTRRERNRWVALQARRQLGRELEDLDSNPFAVAVNKVGHTNNMNYGFMSNLGIGLTDDIDVKWIAGYERWERSSNTDLDFTPNTEFEFQQMDRGFMVSQELQLNGVIDSVVLLNWQVGAQFLFERTEVFSGNDTISDQAGAELERDFKQEIFNQLYWVDLNWDMTEEWGLDLGGRWNSDRKSIDYQLFATPPTNAKEDIEWDSPTARVRLRYAPSSDAEFYVMYTHGWKSGSYNATSNPVSGLTFAEPEKLEAYEFGWRISMFDQRFRLTGALFYYDYFNYQIFTAESNLARLPEFVTINANTAENYGAELEAFIEPFDGTSLRVNFGWLESEFIDFTQNNIEQIDIAGGSLTFNTIVPNTGNRLLNSPNYSVAILFSQVIPLGRFGDFTVQYSGNWRDDVFFDASEGRGVPNSDQQQVLSDFTIGEKAYWLHDASVVWEPLDMNLSITGWVRNFTNEKYRNFSADLNKFLETTIHFIGEPRTYGLSVRLEY